jgi:hypothetical protein
MVARWAGWGLDDAFVCGGFWRDEVGVGLAVGEVLVRMGLAN